MPCAPSKLNRNPPTTAPTMPRAMLRKKPLPLLLTILLPIKPAMTPDISQLIIGVLTSNSY